MANSYDQYEVPVFQPVSGEPSISNAPNSNVINDILGEEKLAQPGEYIWANDFEFDATAGKVFRTLKLHSEELSSATYGRLAELLRTNPEMFEFEPNEENKVKAMLIKRGLWAADQIEQ